MEFEQLSYDNKTFENIPFAENTVSGREFQGCIFRKCDLSNSNFLNDKFIDCTFDGCNLSMMKFGKTTLSDVIFKDCKILGVIFSECQDFLFSVRFEHCILDYSSFMGKKMIKTNFIKTSLKEVNFSNTNLSGAVFVESDLQGAIFNRTDLSAANFVTAYNYSIEPEQNLLKKAVFSANGLTGLLDKYQIKVV